METIEIIGYLSTLLIGVSLGLIGSGGSILTIPVMVYLFAINPTSATSYSLLLVGATALVGALQKLKKGEVELKTALLFGAPAVAAVFLTRKLLIPLIPFQFEFLSLNLKRDQLLLGLFAVLMLLAALSMLRKKSPAAQNESPQPLTISPMIVLLEGFITGIITGLVGAGGGFLIIPALVVFGKLPMKVAVGTSLLIIAAKSLIGFLGDIGNPDITIDYLFITILIIIASLGLYLGIYLSKFIDGKRLAKGFGYFVLLMGAFVISKEIIGF